MIVEKKIIEHVTPHLNYLKEMFSHNLPDIFEKNLKAHIKNCDLDTAHREAVKITFLSTAMRAAGVSAKKIQEGEATDKSIFKELRISLQALEMEWEQLQRDSK